MFSFFMFFMFFMFSFLYIVHFCRIIATALISELMSHPFHSQPSFYIFPTLFPLKRG